jgi:hypothetical protein
MIRRAVGFAVVFVLAYMAVSAIVAHPTSPSWVVTGGACTTGRGCLKGVNNPVLCADQHHPDRTRDVLVTAEQAQRLHVGDPCPATWPGPPVSTSVRQ